MSLLECTKTILSLTESLSGRPVRVQEDPQLQTLATINMARGTAPMHLIRYRPVPQRQPDYHICYQCGFVIRLFENPPESRFDFGKSPEASSKMDLLLADRSLPPQARLMKEMLLNGLMTQLRSIPIGLRIDDWLWNLCQELRGEQTASAYLQLQQNAQVLSPGIRKSFPRKVVNANTAMNAAFAMYWAEKLSDATISLSYRSIGADSNGKALLEITRGLDASPQNDWALVDAWAEELGLRGWHQWIPYKLED
jgi:hypothetical protein